MKPSDEIIWETESTSDLPEDLLRSMLGRNLTEAQKYDLARRLRLPANCVGQTRHVHRTNGIITTVSISGWQTEAPPDPAPVASRVLPFRAPLIAQPQRRGRFWPGTYAEYLATPQWRRLAAAARLEWRYECLINRDHLGPVEVHHRRYPSKPFTEDWRDLVPLCEECHALYHHRIARPPAGWFAEDLTAAA